MNRTAACCLSPRDSGEKIAFEYALNQLNTDKELIFFDVGGNDGDYSNMLKDVCFTKKNNFNLYIFEPASVCFNYLLEKNKDLTNITIHQLALAEEEGSSNLFSPWDGSSGASLADVDYIKLHMPNTTMSSEIVNTISLDNFCQKHKIEKIDFLKLDIEGFELSALKGSHEMIINKKITFIQIEIGAASLTTKSMLFDFWKMLNDSYHFYLILNQGLIEIKEYKPDLECFYGASNFLLELK
jgi:FkbM family methyltransferase